MCLIVCNLGVMHSFYGLLGSGKSKNIFMLYKLRQCSVNQGESPISLTILLCIWFFLCLFVRVLQICFSRKWKGHRQQTILSLEGFSEFNCICKRSGVCTSWYYSRHSGQRSKESSFLLFSFPQYHNNYIMNNHCVIFNNLSEILLIALLL